MRLYEEEEADFSIPWNLSLNYNFNMSKPQSDVKGTINSNLGVNLGFNLTKIGNLECVEIMIFNVMKFPLPKLQLIP
ncbi:MAG: hypothetical protein H6613_02525 [Ignavibacteriales bacterium]|nr:hypothetical protein [Ignavibacteriales bacterium]